MDNQKHGKIVRGFSMVDPEMVSKLHTDIKKRGDQEAAGNSYGYNFREIAQFNFTLPDFSQFDEEFVAFLMKDLVENSTLKALEESGHLNWWTKCSNLQNLYPLLTSGDGNCLLHAASLGIWGVHDRLLNLRQAVYHTLSSSLAEKTLRRRWLWYVWVKNLEEGLVLSADEWQAEWKGVVNMADATPRLPQQLSTVPEASAVENEGTSDSRKEITRRISNSLQPRYESLEEIHIFSLAHVLRRPIIVVSDNWVYDFLGNPLSPIPFAGVYLPIECDPLECCRVPLVLAYSSSHFSPIVSMQPSTQMMENASCCGDSQSPSNEENVKPSSGIKSAIILNPSKLSSTDRAAKSTSDKATKSSDGPATTPMTTSIQAAVSSFYQVTKSTILQAAKSLNPTSSVSTNQGHQLIHAAIPLVDKDFKILPLPFAIDPGAEWNWLEQDDSENIINDKTLTDEMKMSLLKKYLDIVNIDFNVESSPGHNDVTIGKIKEGSVKTSKRYSVPVAKLPCENQPSFYEQVIAGYLEKARERFNFEKETRISEPKQAQSMICANDGCDLYGTVANNYLCTKCFQLQTKSVVKYQGPQYPPSYAPPSYSEAVLDNNQTNQLVNPPGQPSHSEKTTSSKELSQQCRAPDCTFYGTSDKMGYCSKCYGENKK